MQCGQLRAMPELALSCMGNIPILVWQTCECCLIVTYTCFWLRFALRLDRSKNLYPVVIGPRWRISRRRKTSGTVCLWGGWRTAADVSSDGKSGRQDSECQEKGTRVFCGCLQQAVKEKGPFLCWPLQKPSQKVSTLLLQNLWSKQITGEERLCHLDTNGVKMLNVKNRLHAASDSLHKSPAVRREGSVQRGRKLPKCHINSSW